MGFNVQIWRHLDVDVIFTPDHYYVKISMETTEVLWETAGRDPPLYGYSAPDSQVPESAALRESINTAVGELTALRLLVAFLNRIDSAR